MPTCSSGTQMLDLRLEHRNKLQYIKCPSSFSASSISFVPNYITHRARRAFSLSFKRWCTIVCSFFDTCAWKVWFPKPKPNTLFCRTHCNILHTFPFTELFFKNQFFNLVQGSLWAPDFASWNTALEQSPKRHVTINVCINNFI